MQVNDSLISLSLSSNKIGSGKPGRVAVSPGAVMICEMLKVKLHVGLLRLAIDAGEPHTRQPRPEFQSTRLRRWRVDRRGTAGRLALQPLDLVLVWAALL